MAGYGGFFLRGMAGGIQSGFEMGWKKKQQKQLEAKQKEVAEAVTLFNNQIKMYGEDKIYSENEISMMNVAWLSLGSEAQELTKGAKEAILNMNESDIKNTIQLLDNFKDGLSMVDPKDAKAFYNFARTNAKSDKSLNYIDAFEKMQEAKHEAGQEKETLEKSKYLPEEYRYPYLKEQGIVGEITPTGAPTEPSVADKKYDWAIDNYKAGKINFEQLSRFMGTDKDLSAKQQEVELAKQYGATNEEIKKMLLGVRPPTPLIVKMVDPNDVLFGTNGIMKDYINSGSQLGEEQKAEIRNNYNVVKPALNEETRTQVEDYLQQIGIDLAETEPISEPEPEPTKSNWFKDTWKKMTTPGGTPAYEGTPKISTEGKEAMIPMMTNDELYNALKGLDPSDPIYKALYDEAVKRGLIEK